MSLTRGVQPCNGVDPDVEKERWDTCILVIDNLVSQITQACIDCGKIGRVLLLTHPPVFTTHLVPEHLNYMMSPPDIVIEHQLVQVVDVVLKFKAIFFGPDEKVGFTNRVMHK